MRTTGEPTGVELGRSANERFKARWGEFVRWSTVVAVAAHAGILGFTPGWDAPLNPLERATVELRRLVALPLPDEGSSRGESPTAPVPAQEQLDLAASVSGLEEGDEYGDAASVDLWDAVSERLRRGDAPVPTIASPVSDPALEGPGPEEPRTDSLSVRADAALADLRQLPEPTSLALDRLSDLRPELAVVMPSAWVLIQNPTEVEAFLRRGYQSGTLDRSAKGSVGITLWIDERGSVEWAEVSASSGRRDLDEYALALFNEVATFRAARERGVSVSRSVTLSLNFPW